MSLLKLCQRFCGLSLSQFSKPTPAYVNFTSLCRNFSPAVCKPAQVSLPLAPALNLENQRCISLNQLHRKGSYWRRKRVSSHMEGKPFMRGVVLKLVIKKPKKPNSANRKCVRLRLSNGIERVAYIPGEGHTLQEHSIVLVKGGRLQDVPGVKLVCVRGKYDLAHVKK